MSHPPIEPKSDLQRVVLEQALAYAAQLEQTAQTAPSGQTLDSCERVVLQQGRQFLRDSLAAALQQQIHEGEKKGLPLAPVPAVGSAATRAPIRARS
jgi:hypothetical protein